MKNNQNNKHKHVLFIYSTQGITKLSLAVVYGLVKILTGLFLVCVKVLGHLKSSTSRARALSFLGASFSTVRHHADSTSRARALDLLGVLFNSKDRFQLEASSTSRARALSLLWAGKEQGGQTDLTSRARALSLFGFFGKAGLRTSSTSRARALSLFGALLVTLSILVAIPLADTANAATSNQLNFQGRLLTNTGGLVPDGTYNFQFDLYYQAVGGSSQWTEDRLNINAQGVTIRNGYFSVYLGEYDAIPALNWSEDLYLGMTVRGTGSCAWGACTPADSQMTPRFKLTAVPYAFRAANVASSSTNAASTNSDGVSITTGNAAGSTSNSGNITIDTGTATGTTGTISLGAGNASALTIGNGSATTSLQGQVAVTGSGTALQVTNNASIGGTLGVTGLTTASGGLTVGTGSNFINQGSTLFSSLAISDVSGGGNIGSAATTVDVATTFNVNQTTGGQTLTLPNPTTATAGRIAFVNNVGSVSFEIYGSVIGVGQSNTFIWNGSSWVTTVSLSSNVVNVVGTINSQTKSADGAVISANAIYLQTADATYPGLVSTGTQTFAGVKTFNDGIVLAANQTLTVTGGTTANRPGAPTEGMIYFDTDTDSLLVYANGKWQADRTSVTKTVAPNNASQAIKDSADYVADGTSDEDEINAALTSATGGKVYLFEGTFVADGTVLIPNNTTLAGAGAGTVIELADLDVTENLIENSDTSTGTSVVIQDMVLNGRNDLNTAGTQHGITFVGMGASGGLGARQGAKISNLWINNFRDYGVHINTSSNNTLIGNSAQNNTTRGFSILSSSNNILTNNRAHGSTRGFHIAGASSSQNILSSNIARGNSAAGILIFNGANRNTIANNSLINNGGTNTNQGIYISEGDFNQITGNEIYDDSCTTSCYAIDISDSTSDKNYLEGNRFSGSAANAASINDAGTGTIYAGQQTNSTTITDSNVSDFRFRGSANSATAFAIQNAAGTSILNVNTSTAGVSIDGTLTVSNMATFNGGLTVATGQNFVNQGSTLFSSMAISDVSGGGNIGSAATTVDVATTFNVNQTTAGQTLTLPNPTVATSGRIAFVNNVGSVSFEMYGSVMAAGQSNTFIWNGSSWVTTVSLSGSVVNVIGTLDSQTKSADGAVIAANAIYLQTADASYAGLVSTGTQTFAGAKTFNGQIVTGGGINLGSQTIQGTTAVIDFTNFDVDASGSVTTTGNLTVSGTGTSSFAGSLVVGDNTPSDARLQVVGGNQTAVPTDWTPRTAAENTAWASVTYGGGRFVAVATSGTNQVMYSDDGITWLSAAAAEAAEWRGVTYGGGRFVAVARSGGANRIMYSDDGETWFTASAPEMNTWNAVTYGGGRFVAVASSGTNRVMYSDDGETWFTASATEPNQWFSVTYGGSQFVAVSRDGTNRVMTSADGQSWAAYAAPQANSWNAVTYSGSRYVAVSLNGVNRVMYSDDGQTWQSATAAELNVWAGVSYGNGHYVAVAQSGVNRVMTSVDGVTWTPQSATENSLWQSITYGSSQFVAVNNNGINQVMTSGGGRSVGLRVVGSTELQGRVHVTGVLTVANNFGVFGNARFQSPVNNTEAFAIQNATGSNVFVADTVNSRIGINIGGSTPANRLSVNTLTTADAAAQVAISTGVVGNKGLIVQAVVGQTANLFEVQDSGGFVLSRFDNNGNLRTNRLYVTNSGPNLTKAEFTASASQTVDILQIKANGGATLSGFNNVGNLFYTNSSFTSVLSSATLTNNQSIVLPDASGTVLLDSTLATTAFVQGGNNFGGAGTLGLTSNHDLNIITNNQTRLTVSAGGTTTFNGPVVLAASQSLRITGGNTASRPGSPTEGMIYFDTDTDQLIVYANGKWQADKTSVTKTVAPNNASQAIKDSADYVADGTSDEDEINAALTAAAGGKVYLFEGTFVADGTILIPNNTTLAGAGAGTFIQLANMGGAAENLIENSDTTTGTGVTIRDLQIDGQQSIQTPAANHNGIYMNNMGNPGSSRAGAYITNVIARNFSNVGSNGHGIVLNSSHISVISGNTSLNNLGRGIYLSGSSNNNVTNNITSANAMGIWAIGSSNNNTISNNIAVTNAVNGIFIQGSNDNIVSNNRLHANGAGGSNDSILITSSDRNLITSNRITDTAGTGHAINISDSASDNNYLADNIYSGTGATTINNAGTGTIYGGQVDASGNYVIQPTGSISLLANTDITGNLTVSGTSTFTGLATFNGGVTLEVGDTFTFNGDAFTDLTGTGLTISGGALQTTLGTDIDLTSEVTGVLPVANGGTGAGTLTGILLGNGISPITALTTSAGIAGAISDETGTGNLVFSNAPSFTGTVAGANLTLSGTLGVTGLATFSGGLTVTTGQNFVNQGSTLLSAINISDLAGGGNIGSAATTVDVATTFNVNQTTAGQAVTLPTPTVSTAGRIVYVNNVGSTGFTMYGSNVSVGGSATFIWNGSAWTYTVSFASTGVDTLAPIGSSPNANGATITGTTLTLQPADGTFGGVVSATTQTFAGAKTFSSLLTAQSGLTVSGGIINNLTDNTADILDVQEGTNNYINISTVNGSENISFGNAVTNPTYSFLGSGATTFGGNVNMGFNQLYQATIQGGRLGDQLDGNGQSIANLTYIGGTTGSNLEIAAFGNAGTYLKLRTADSGGTPMDRIAIQSGVDSAKISFGSQTGSVSDIDFENNDVVGLLDVYGSPDGNLHLQSMGGYDIVLTPDGPGILQLDGDTVANTTLTVTGLATFNGGLTVEAGDTFTMNGDAFTDLTGNGLQVSGNALTLLVQANKGLEVDANGISLIDCGDGQILRYSTGTNQWACADSSGTGSDEIITVAADDTPADKKAAADYVADGTSDETEINTALTAAAGGKVILLEGTFVVDGTILIPNNTTLEGQGNGTVIEFDYLGGGNDNMIENSDTSTGTGITIRDLTLDGRKDINDSGFVEGIYLNNMGSSTRKGGIIQNITVRNFYANAIIAFSSGQNTIIGNTLHDNDNSGIQTVLSTQNIITNNLFEANTQGIYLSGETNSKLTNNIFSNHTSSVINTTLNSSGLIISDNIINDNAVYGIFAADLNESLISNNSLHNNGGSGSWAAIIISLSDYTSNGNQVIGNRITDPAGTGYAIEIFGASNTYLADNYYSGSGANSINDAGTGTIFGGQLTGNNYTIQPAGTIELLANTNITGNLTVSGTSTFTGLATFDGNLRISDGSSNYATIVVQSTSGDYTYTIPTTTGNDTFCLYTLNNCAGTATTLQSAYTNDADGSDAVIVLTATDGAVVVRDASSTIGTLFVVEANGGSDYFAVASSGITLGVNTTLVANQSLTITGGNTGSRPGSPTEGMVYFDTDTDRLLTYANGKWQADRTDAILLAANNSSQADKDAADYVADGTGDQTEINAALTAAAGKKVVLLAGTYVASATISVPNNTTLTGVGRGTVIELADIDATDNLIENTDQTTGTGVTIRDLRINGRRDLNTAGVQVGINMDDMGGGVGGSARTGALITNVWVENFRTTGIVLWESAHTTITGNTVQNNGITGIELTESERNTVTSNSTRGNGLYGIRLTESIMNAISSNVVQNNGDDGIRLTTNSYDNNITSNSILLNGDNGIYLSGSNSNNITGNNIQDNGVDGIDADGVSLVISGNQLSWNGRRGLSLGGSDSSVSGNNFRSNTEEGILVGGARHVVSGNNFVDNYGSSHNYAIALNSSANSAQVTGNTISDNSCTITCYAIDIIGTPTGVYLSSNNLINGTIRNNGTNTVFGGQTLSSTSDFLFRGTNSATAFAVQNASGASFLNVDTTGTGTSLTVTSNGTGSGQLINLTNTTGTQTNGLYINRNGAGGTTTNLLHLQNTAGTATNGILFTGTIGTDITTAAARNLNIITGTTGQLNLDTGSTGSINLGTNANAKAITIGNTTSTTSLLLQSGTGDVAIQSQDDINIGTNAVAQDITIGNGTGATSVTINAGTGALNIGTNAVARTIAVGNTTGASALNLRVGTGNFTLDGVAGSTYTLGASTTTGTITIGGTAQTGNLTLGSSSGTNSVLIGNGSGATTVNIANVTTGGAVNIGAAMTTGTITIGGTGAQTGTIALGTGTGAQAINLGTGAGAKTLQLGSTNTTSTTTINAGSGFINFNATQTQFTEITGTRELTVQTRTTNVAGSNLRISAGNAGTGGGAFVGGLLTLQGGNAAGTGNVVGGGVLISGGTGVGTGVLGLVRLAPTAFESSGSAQTHSITGNITDVDIYSTVAVNATNPSLILTLPVPNATNQVIGRVIYVTATSASNDFTLRLGGTNIDIAMKSNSTATLIWNGTGWTAAGASSSTDLQSAYNNTLTSAGGAELILNASGGPSDGLTIRNNATTPIVGGLLEVQNSIGSNLFTVNNNATEYATNGGGETAGTSTCGSTFPANTWDTTTGGTCARYTTTGSYIATGQGSVSIVTTNTNHGLRNRLSTTLTSGLTYTVSFAVRGTTSFSTLQVLYSPDGTTSGTTQCATAQFVTTGIWTRITCSFVASGSINANNSILIRQTDSTGRTFYVDNLSVNINASVTYAADGSVDDIGGFGTNWTAFGAGSVASRDTVTIYDSNGSARVNTTNATNRGITNNLSIAPAINTQYLVSFYARSGTGSINDLTVRYSRDGGTNFANCVDYNRQDIVTTEWRKITCLFTTDGTSPSNADLIFTQAAAPGGTRSIYIDALTVTLNTNNSNNVQIGGGNRGGPVTLFTLDRSAGSPIAANNDAYLGSMYYDTVTGRIQCYEADGWGACGAAPDNIVNLNPEYAGAVLNGSGVGVMSADFCGNGAGLNINTSLCASGEAKNYYKWTSPQASMQTYSIFVTYQLPATFDGFTNDDTVQLAARVDSTTNASVTYEMYKSASGSLTQCGSGETDVIVGDGTGAYGSANTWYSYGINGNEATGCSFNASTANGFVIFKINVKARSNASAYVGTLNFVTAGR